jgi:hypothetical protein
LPQRPRCRSAQGWLLLGEGRQLTKIDHSALPHIGAASCVCTWRVLDLRLRHVILPDGLREQCGREGVDVVTQLVGAIARAVQ